MGSVSHIPVVGRKINKTDYAALHLLDLDPSDIEEALGYVPADAASVPPPVDLGPYATDADLAAGLATKSDVGHDHDARYYTEAEVNALLVGYASSLLVPAVVAGTSYTILPADSYAAKALTNAALVTITVPDDPAIAVGSRCRFCAEGAAGALVAEAVGVTIINRGNKRAAAQGSIFELHKRSASVWWLLGDVQ